MYRPGDALRKSLVRVGQEGDTVLKRVAPFFLIAPFVFSRPTSSADSQFKLIDKIAVPTGPKSIYLMPDGKHVWANCLYAHRCVIIDVATRKIVKEFKVPDEPVECCFTQNGKLAWVSQYNKSAVVVLDTTSGKLLHAIKVGQVPKIVRASPDDRWVYAANFGSADLTVIDAQKFAPVKTIKLRRHPRGICFPPDSKFAFVCCMGGQALAKIEVADNHKLVGYVGAGTTPRHAVSTKRGHRLYVSNNLTAQVSKIDVAAEKIIATCRVGRQARTIALTPDEKLLFVCNNGDDSISVVNTESMKERLRLKTGKHPIGCTVTADGKQFWVSSYPWSKVYIYEITANSGAQHAIQP